MFFVGVGRCMNFLFFWRGICLYWALVGVCDEIEFVYYDLILSCCYYKYKTYFSVLPVFFVFLWLGMVYVGKKHIKCALFCGKKCKKWRISAGLRGFWLESCCFNAELACIAVDV